jgi:SH3-like domain-containing protein
MTAEPIDSGKCEPYFASIKESEANLHIGPGTEYKIVVRYVVKGVPVLVTAKYDHWRKVRDIDGEEGWIHKRFLSRERYALVKNSLVVVYKDPDIKSEHVANLKKNVIVKLISIKKKWSNIYVKYRDNVYTGWILNDLVFGALEHITTRM